MPISTILSIDKSLKIILLSFSMSQQVSHGAIQFTAYEELRKITVDFRSKRSTVRNQNPDKLLVS